MKYTKGNKTRLSANLSSTEFDCHGKGCCTETEIESKLIDIVQKIREHFGKPIIVSSGYRCPVHNKSVNGATSSRHMKGQAADVYIEGVEPIEIARYAESIGVKGIGLYETDKDGYFVHVDTRTSKYFWYGQSEAPRSTFGATQEQKKIDTSKVNTAPIDEKKMWDYFLKSGMTECGVAGLMGNLNAESALYPTNLQNSYEKSLGMSDAEYTAAVDAGRYTNFVNDSAGYGLAQWTYWSLKRDMLAYHQKKGKSIGDGETQMEFLVHQLSTQYIAVWRILTSAKTVREASDAVLLKFERPADQSEAVQKKRADFGQNYYNKFALKTQSPKVEETTQTIQSKPTLCNGDEGEAVRKLQTNLKRLGFDCKGIDGDFGANTQSAVYGFQRERNLDPDGICGPKTWAEIDSSKSWKVTVTASVLNVRSGPSTSTSIKSQLRRGSEAVLVYKKSNWGKLENGAGWICLDYTK